MIHINDTQGNQSNQWVPATFGPPEKGGKKKKKNPNINTGQPARKRVGEKKTLGRSDAYTVNPLEKGEKKNPGQLAGPRFQDLDFRTWVSRPRSQDLGFKTQTDARNASYGRLIFFPSFFSASTITFLFLVTQSVRLVVIDKLRPVVTDRRTMHRCVKKHWNTPVPNFSYVGIRDPLVPNNVIRKKHLSESESCLFVVLITTQWLDVQLSRTVQSSICSGVFNSNSEPENPRFRLFYGPKELML